MTNPGFELKPEHLTSVEEEFTIVGEYKSLGSVDHPSFAKLRNILEGRLLIKTERNWVNGDRVLAPFTLNGVQFLPGERFVCAAAMWHHLKKGS